MKIESASKKFISREQALNQIKRDLDIPCSQNPIRQEMVPLLDEYGKRILDENGSFVYSRELTYSVSGKFDVQGNPVTKVVVQDHSYGHVYSDGIGNQSTHYNVRPYNNTKTGRIRGLRDHYYFDYRNEK